METCTFLLLQNGVDRAEFLLKQALYEDERGRPDDALPLYTDAAELCIKTVSCLDYITCTLLIIITLFYGLGFYYCYYYYYYYCYYYYYY